MSAGNPARRGGLLAGLIGLLLAALVHAWVWESPGDFTRRMDFNGGPFEDFMGPYFEQGRALLAGSREPVPGFLYTPFFAGSMVPLAAAGPAWAPWIWLGVLLASCAALVAMVGPARQAAGLAPVGALPRCAWFAAAGLCFPLFHGLHWGQVSALVTAGLLGGLVLAARGRPWLGGALVGAAAAIKLYPLLLLAVLACLPGRRALVGAAGSFLVLGLGLPVLALGAGPTWDFYGAVFARIQAASPGWVDVPAAQFAGAVLSRGLPAELDRDLLSLAPRLVALGLGALALRRVAGGGPWLRPATALVCCLPLALPPAWPHYFAWLPLAWGLAWPGPERSAPYRWCAGAAVVGSAAAASVAAFHVAGSYAAYFDAGWLLGASLLLVPLLLAPEPGADAPTAGAA